MVVGGYVFILPHNAMENRSMIIATQRVLFDVIDDQFGQYVRDHDVNGIAKIVDSVNQQNPFWVTVEIFDKRNTRLYATGASSSKLKSSVVSLSIPLWLGDERVGAATIAVDVTNGDELAKHQIEEYLVTIILPISIVMLIAVAYHEWTVIRPLRQMATSSRQISENNFDVEFPRRVGGELAEMSKSLMDMRDRIRASWQEMSDETIQAKQGEIQTLKENEERLRAIVENVVDAIVTIDAHGIVNSANNAVKSMFGYSPDELIGQNVAILIPQDGLPQHHDRYIKKYLETGQAGIIGIGRELVARHKSGSVFPIELAIAEFHHKGERMFVGIMRDISKRKQTEAMLQKAKKAAEHASQMKSRFVANMSHELRTPLNGVLGMLDLVKESELTPEQRHYIDVAFKSSDSLHRVIDRILDFSKIEAGQLLLEPSEFNPAQTIAEVVEIFAVAAKKNNNALHWQAINTLPKQCVGDVFRIKQILNNLLSNAIKFTQNGSVTVTVSMRDLESASEAVLQFEVSDTGIGIEAERQEAIFSPFTQADVSTSRQYGGTGLGLSISRQLSELMGGSIDVESRLGHGSTFRFRTPVVIVDELAPNQNKMARNENERSSARGNLRHDRPRCLLVVEDNAINQLVMQGLLNKLGILVEVATDGEAALQLIEENSYDGVLMDIQMPGMDGLEATQRIRARHDAKRDILIIGVSADATNEVRNDALRKGMNDYLTKPVSLAMLMAALTKNGLL